MNIKKLPLPLPKTRLQAGQPAPKFQATDSYGKGVDLANYPGKSVLLVFLRYSGCPWCNLTIHRLTMEYKLLQRDGCEVIAVVQSSADNIVKNIYGRHKLRPPFPIIPDSSQKLYAKYGIKPSLLQSVKKIRKAPYWLKSVYTHGFHQADVDGNLLMVPAMFLIAPDKTILLADYQADLYDHESLTAVYEALTFRL